MAMIIFRVAALLFTLLVTACSHIAQQGDEHVTDNEQPAATEEIAVRPFPDDSFYELLVAEFAVRRQHYDIALQAYLQQAELTLDPGVIHRAIRMAQFLHADQAALDAAQLWVEVEPDNTEAHFTVATLLAKFKQPQQAFKHMQLTLEHGGKVNFTVIATSALRLPEPSRNELEAQFDQLLLTHSENTELLIGKALLLQQRGQKEQALATIRRALSINPDNLHAVVTEARLLQQLGRNEEAYVHLQQAVDQHPNNQRLRLQYARLLMKSHLDESKRQFEILLISSPNDPDLLLALALISKERKELDDAEHYFQRLLASGKRNPQAHFHLGQLAEQHQNWAQALEHYQQVPPGKNFPQTLNRIITIYLRLDQVDHALQHLQQLRQQHPKQAVHLYLLESEVLMSDNRLEPAHQLLSEALEQHPEQSSLRYARSMLSEKRGDLELMEQDLRQLIAENPVNSVALNALGYTLSNHSDRYDEAYQLITQALQLKPGDPAILDSLGWVEYRRGNLQQALTLLQQAYQGFPDHEVAAHLGEVLWTLGRHQQAQKIWKEGLKRRPDSEIIIKTIKRLQAAAHSEPSQP